MATKKLTPVKRKPTPADTSDISNDLKIDDKNSKNTTKSNEDHDVQSLILEELKKQTEYLHRVDWKLWVMMGMIKLIGEENGYTFKSQDNEKEEEISTPKNVNKLATKPWEN